MLNDVLSGIVAIGAVFVLSILTGGFSFYQPWIIWSVIALFIAGLFRGNRNQSIWPTVALINSSWALASILLMTGHEPSSDDWWVAVAIVGSLLPTAAGVSLKRRFS